MYNLSCHSTLEQGTFSLPAASPFKGVTRQYPKTTHDGAVEQLKEEPRCVFSPSFLFWKTSMGTLDLHVRPSVPMGALGRLG